MSDISGYDDLDTGTAPRVAVIAPHTEINEGRAREYMAQHRGRAATAEDRFNAIMRQRAEAIAEAKTQLDETITRMREKQTGEGPWGVNLPLLAFGAGLLTPGPPGTVSNFGSELGRGLTAMGQTIRAQRMNDVDFEKGISELRQKHAGLTDRQLSDEAALARQQAIKEDSHVADLEKSLIKSGGVAGSKPARVAEYQEWLKDPTNAGKSYGDFLKWRAEIGANKDEPAVVREYKIWKEDPKNKDKTLSDFYGEKAGATARGKEVGKAQGEATTALPGQEMSFDVMASTIDKLEKHPGADKTFGLPNALLPNVPGGDAADFEALRQQLTGQAFLLQFDKLRGAGQITEAEGKKATDALTTLATTQSKKQFLENLTYLKGLVARARDVAKTKAGVEAKPPMEGARKTPDGRWVIERDGKFFEVQQ